MIKKHIIDKSFSFCYGHRVHNQRLDTNFTESGNACLACRHLHGHEGLVKIFLEEIDTGKNIKNTGMVTDFKHLGWFKNFIDDTLDHKMILDLQDPLLKEECNYLLNDDGEFDTDLIYAMQEGYWLPDLTHIKKDLNNMDKKWPGTYGPGEKDAIYEKYEGMVFVDFVPTSENLAGWLLEIAQKKMEGISNVRVKAVEYWETPKSHCRVENANV
jgi:6-pyruvoyltetrahydropterin/6-carboxytetrahydropterin synthase